MLVRFGQRMPEFSTNGGAKPTSFRRDSMDGASGRSPGDPTIVPQRRGGAQPLLSAVPFVPCRLPDTVHDEPLVEDRTEPDAFAHTVPRHGAVFRIVR
jgi:hypothetical protein